jgi:hypothetical protein
LLLDSAMTPSILLELARDKTLIKGSYDIGNKMEA